MSARLVGWVPEQGRLDTPLGTVVRIGASRENDVVVRIDGVSKKHARIVEATDGHWLEDAGSRNGTWLNGDRVSRARLQHLDVITLGRFAELVFVRRDAAAPAVRDADELRARLEWQDGPEAGRIIDLPRGETIVGRAESCAIVIDSAAVSRTHLRITHTAEGVTVEDLGSVNGTTVNGEPVTGAMAVESGAAIDVGQARRFRLLIDGRPRPAAGAPLLRPASTAPDLEWATRLVWSATDREMVKAAGLDIPAASGSPPVPPTPPPAAAGRAPSAPTADGHPTVRASAAPTALGMSGIKAPPELDRAPDESADHTKQFGRGIAPVPAALGRAGKPPSPPSRPDETVGATPVAADDAPPPTAPMAGAAGEAGGATTPTAVGDADLTRPPSVLRSPSERTNLPPSTLLGYRDVAPPKAGTTAGQGSRSRREWSADSPDSAPGVAPIASVTLTGASGTFTLSRGTATVGRSADATIRIDSREISRVHAIITVTADAVTVEDRGSVNGTTVNGARMSDHRALRAGDRVCFADFEFRVDVNRSEEGS